jgi:hypothetical protein
MHAPPGAFALGAALLGPDALPLAGVEYVLPPASAE